MAALSLRVTTQHAEQDFGLDDLRGEILRWVVGCCWAVAGALVAYLALVSFTPFAENWLIALALLAIGLLAWRVATVSLRVGATMLTVGLTLSIGAALYLYPASPVACSLSVVVIVANVLIGPRTGLAAALAVTVVILATLHHREGLVAGDVAVMAVFLIWANAILAWLGSQPLYTALHWAWSSFVQAQEKIEQLRDSRGELGRLSKSLQEACIRLEQLNAELDRARRAAEEARRQKADFATAVSHELRTPLNLVIGFSEMMITNPESSYGERLPETYREDVEAIYRSASHISHLVDDILDLSQIEAHRMGLHKERVSLVRIVDEAVATIGSLFRDKGLFLRVSLPPDLPLVYVDPTRVRQVLLNLLSNAARFTDDGGVTVTARPNEREVVVSVADTGVGVSEEDLPLVFQEFRQLGGFRRHKGGSGLGLAVSKRFIELHGGNMWVETEQDQGTTFHFTVPVDETAVISSLEGEASTWARLGAAGEREKVLAVLDSTTDREATRIFQRYLDRFCVVGVKHLREAHQLAKEGKLHALLVTGCACTHRLAQRAKAEFPQLPMAFCSLSGIGTPAREMGVRAYLVKPVVRRQLQATLRRLGSRVRSVLVVDDDPEMLRLLTQMLRACSRHYQVWQAKGGAEALKALRQARPDAVLLDLIMPEVDGHAVLHGMRHDERLRDVPVVVITARDYEEQVVKIDALGVTRAGGLSVGEGSRCLKACLDSLLHV